MSYKQVHKTSFRSSNLVEYEVAPADTGIFIIRVPEEPNYLSLRGCLTSQLSGMDIYNTIAICLSMEIVV